MSKSAWRAARGQFLLPLLLFGLYLQSISVFSMFLGPDYDPTPSCSGVKVLYYFSYIILVEDLRKVESTSLFFWER